MRSMVEREAPVWAGWPSGRFRPVAEVRNVGSRQRPPMSAFGQGANFAKTPRSGHYRFLKGRQTPSSARLSRHKGQAKETPPARIQTSPNK